MNNDYHTIYNLYYMIYYYINILYNYLDILSNYYLYYYNNNTIYNLYMIFDLYIYCNLIYIYYIMYCLDSNLFGKIDMRNNFNGNKFGNGSYTNYMRCMCQLLWMYLLLRDIGMRYILCNRRNKINNLKLSMVNIDLNY